MQGKGPENTTDVPEVTQPPSKGLWSRCGQGIKWVGGTCWRGIKFVAKFIHNPAVIALSAVGAAGMIYGGGSVITTLAGPSLWLLAAPVVGVVGTIAVKFRPRNKANAEKFQTLENMFDHFTKIVSATGFHYLYFSRIAKEINGGPLSSTVTIVIPVTAFSTAVLGHILNEFIKSKNDPNCLLVIVNSTVAQPIKCGSALSPTLYVFGPDNAGLLDPRIILYILIALTAAGLINETLIKCLSKKAKIVVDGGFNCMQGLSRTAYLLSTIESLIALNNNDDVPLTQLLVTSGLLATIVLPFDISVSLRRRINEYRLLNQPKDYSLLLENNSIQQDVEPVIDHSTATWQVPECQCVRRKQIGNQGFFKPVNQDQSTGIDETVVVETAPEGPAVVVVEGHSGALAPTEKTSGSPSAVL